MQETLRDIAIEPTRRASIGREADINIVMINTGEMDAVVMKEDPSSVGLVVVADEVLRSADSELDATTDRRETMRQGRGECCSLCPRQGRS